MMKILSIFLVLLLNTSFAEDPACKQQRVVLESQYNLESVLLDKIRSSKSISNAFARESLDKDDFDIINDVNHSGWFTVYESFQAKLLALAKDARDVPSYVGLDDQGLMLKYGLKLADKEIDLIISTGKIKDIKDLEAAAPKIIAIQSNGNNYRTLRDFYSSLLGAQCYDANKTIEKDPLLGEVISYGNEVCDE